MNSNLLSIVSGVFKWKISATLIISGPVYEQEHKSIKGWNVGIYRNLNWNQTALQPQFGWLELLTGSY